MAKSSDWTAPFGWLRSDRAECRRSRRGTVIRRTAGVNRHETQRIGLPRDPRRAVPLPLLGRSRSTEALPAPRLDGCLGVLPVLRRLARRALACDRARLAGLRADAVERGRQLL